MRVLVTGASGFIGKHLVEVLEREKIQVREAGRRRLETGAQDYHSIDFGNTPNKNDWLSLCDKVDAVVHLAGAAHAPIKDDAKSRATIRTVNVEAPIKMLEASIEMGVRKFVFLSSVKAMAESNRFDGLGEPIPLKEGDVENPADVYGRSKLEAERALREAAEGSNIELVMLRSPLVYGVNQKANMKVLFTLVRKNVPLPILGLKNARSLISVNNLCDAIAVVLNTNTHPTGAYLVSDVDLSTIQLVREIGYAMGKKVRLFRVPLKVLRSLARAIGSESKLNKLADSLIIDSSRFRADYSWEPKIDCRSVLKEIAKSECKK